MHRGFARNMLRLERDRDGGLSAVRPQIRATCVRAPGDFDVSEDKNQLERFSLKYKSNLKLVINKRTQKSLCQVMLIFNALLT